jgi:hypothetical protein
MLKKLMKSLRKALFVMSLLAPAISLTACSAYSPFAVQTITRIIMKDDRGYSRPGQKLGISDLQASYGAGILYSTPRGHLRIDYFRRSAAAPVKARESFMSLLGIHFNQVIQSPRFGVV